MDQAIFGLTLRRKALVVEDGYRVTVIAGYLLFGGGGVWLKKMISFFNTAPKGQFANKRFRLEDNGK